MSSIYVTSGDAYLSTRRLVVTVTDPAAAAVDLTGVDLTFMVKRRRNDANDDALITKTTADVAEVEIASPQSGATKGVAYIALEEADTDDLQDVVGGYPWELEADDTIGKITLASGRFYVQQDLVMP